MKTDSRDKVTNCTDATLREKGSGVDWLATARRDNIELRRDLRRSERDHDFRQRVLHWADDLTRMVMLPDCTEQCNADTHPELAATLAERERVRLELARRRACIESHEPFAEWIARRFVRIAWSLHKYLNSQHIPYARPTVKGHCAAFAYDVIELAASRERHQEAQGILCERLKLELGRIEEWTLAFGYASGGDSFFYIVSGSIWNSLLLAAKRAQEERLIAHRNARRASSTARKPAESPKKPLSAASGTKVATTTQGESGSVGTAIASDSGTLDTSEQESLNAEPTMPWQDKAIGLLAGSGCELKVEELAKRVGVSRSTLYRDKRVNRALKARPRKKPIRKTQLWESSRIDALGQ